MMIIRICQYMGGYAMYNCMQHTKFKGGEDSHEGDKISPLGLIEKTLLHVCSLNYGRIIYLHVPLLLSDYRVL